MNEPKRGVVWRPGTPPPPLPPRIQREVQRILDRAARRLLEERLKGGNEANGR